MNNIWARENDGNKYVWDWDKMMVNNHKCSYILRWNEEENILEGYEVDDEVIEWKPICSYDDAIQAYREHMAEQALLELE